MKILIAGGTGFIGQALVKRWRSTHQITVLGRSRKKIEKLFAATVNSLTWDELSTDSLKDIDVVINLNGASIGDARWSNVKRQEILDSRINPTNQLAELCASLGNDAPMLFNASAIGTYGLQASLKNGLPEAFDEDTPIDFELYPDFLAEIGRRWEQALQPAIDAGVRVVIMRFAVVLGDGGVLSKLKLPYLLGLGGTIGSGRQPFCWVALSDLINAIEFLIEHKDVSGAVNIVSPNCVTQAEFAKTLGKILHRPTFLVTPSFLLKALLGQMAEELLLHGQHVKPKRLTDLGFEFQSSDLEKTLGSVFK